MFQIIWSPLASETYLETLNFIISNWSITIAQQFDDQVSELLSKLRKYENLCPPSKKLPGLRKCTISEQTSLIYQIVGNEIQLITFLDNRSRHPY